MAHKLLCCFGSVCFSANGNIPLFSSYNPSRNVVYVEKDYLFSEYLSIRLNKHFRPSFILKLHEPFLRASKSAILYAGTKCDDFHCSQPHGYLIYKSSYNSYLRRRTITSMGKPTTFVLHFKNITVSGFKCDR